MEGMEVGNRAGVPPLETGLLSPAANFLRKLSLLETRAVSPENFPGEGRGGKGRRGEERGGVEQSKG